MQTFVPVCVDTHFVIIITDLVWRGTNEQSLGLRWRRTGQGYFLAFCKIRADSKLRSALCLRLCEGERGGRAAPVRSRSQKDRWTVGRVNKTRWISPWETDSLPGHFSTRFSAEPSRHRRSCREAGYLWTTNTGVLQVTLQLLWNMHHPVKTKLSCDSHDALNHTHTHTQTGANYSGWILQPVWWRLTETGVTGLFLQCICRLCSGRWSWCNEPPLHRRK